MEKKMIYLLNHYSKNSVQHFFHVINLLENIADHGVEIALVIEKCDDPLELKHKNIHVYAQKEKEKVARSRELYRITKKLINDGYKKIYIRISIAATLIICRCAHKYGAEVYYWQSGDAFSFYRTLPLGKRIRWNLTGYVPYAMVKNAVDYFVTGPEYMVNYYATEGHVKRDKIKLLYNDIDDSRFSVVSREEKLQIRKELGLQSDKYYVLAIHRFSDYRRTPWYIPYIFSSYKESKNVEFIIIGSGGSEEKDVRRNTDGWNNIHMLGSKPNATIQKYYNACDLFVNPSFSEGFPRVIIEAMGSGLPVVATAAGGTRDLFEDIQQPFITNKDDRDALKVALEKMIEDPQLQEKCSESNRRRVHKYSTEEVAEMYIDLLWNQKDVML